MEDLNVDFNDASSREIFYLARKGTFIFEQRKVSFLGRIVMSLNLLDDKDPGGGIMAEERRTYRRGFAIPSSPSRKNGFFDVAFTKVIRNSQSARSNRTCASSTACFIDISHPLLSRDTLRNLSDKIHLSNILTGDLSRERKSEKS